MARRPSPFTSRFVQERRASIHCARRFAIAVFGVVALVTACSPIPRSSEADARPVQKSTSPYGSESCFYSDVSGADRVTGGRVLHWCGPKPKPLN